MSAPLKAALPAGGQVMIQVRWRGGRLTGLDLASRRPTAARLMVGKTAAEVLALMPRLFSLCGKAQEAAARTALALAQAPYEALPARDDAHAPLRREVIGEHLWRLLMDWPARLSSLPNLSHGDSLRSQKKPDNATFASLYRRLRSSESVVDLLPDLLAALAALPRDDMLAALSEWDARALPADFRTLPELTPERVGSLFSSRTTRFAEAPEWLGQAAEVGALARYLAHPELMALAASGRPLAARLLARCLALQDDIAALAAGEEVPVSGLAIAKGSALAWVDTARGPLCHRVSLVDGRVSDYAVIAPTEWNFHPQAQWRKHLIGARAETPEIAENLLRLWALALDPCVPIHLTLVKED